MAPINFKPHEPQYWIIVSDEGHASVPKKHTSRFDADKEALRLASAHPGISFTVFESKVAYKSPVANVERTEFLSPGWEYNFYTVNNSGWERIR